MKTQALVFFLVCTILSVDIGDALKCYSCSAVTGQDSDCEKHVEKAHVDECTAGLDACSTLIAGNGIVRSCLVKNGCDLIDSSTYKHCSTCSTDLCNTYSAGFVPSYSIALGISMAFFTIMKVLA